LPTDAPYEWREITLTELSLNASTKYAVVVRATSGDTSNVLYWRYDYADATYGDGDFEGSVNSGSSWTILSGSDAMFEVWGNSLGDTTPPTYSNIGTNTTQAGQPCVFSCLWADETNMSGFVFGTNNTGVWTNESWTSTWSNWPTTKSAWANITKTLNVTVGAIVQYEWWTNDTSNNWNNTGILSLTAIILHTFGYETKGATGLWIASSGSTSHIEGSVYSTIENGVASTITTWIKNEDATYSVHAKCAIYLHSNLSLVAATEELSISPSYNDWKTFNFPSPPNLLAHTDYVLVAWASTPTSSLKYVWIYASSTVATDSEHWQSIAYDGFPNPLVPTHGSWNCSIYCTYTTALPPTYSNVNTNTSQSGQPCQFTTLWSADTNVSGYVFGTNNTGAWTNETWVSFTVFYNATAAWSNITKTLNSTVNTRVEWQIWCNNTSNDWSNTGIQFLITMDVHYDAYLYVDTFTAESVDWTENGISPYLDNAYDSSFINSTGYDQREGNFTFTHLPSSNTYTVCNVTFNFLIGTTLSSSLVEVYWKYDGTWQHFELNATNNMQWQTFNMWSYFADDAETRINNTKFYVLQVYGSFPMYIYGTFLGVDYTTKPLLIKSTQPTDLWSPPTMGTGTIYSKWKCNKGLSTYAFNHNASGSWLPENLTGSLTGTVAWVNTSISIPQDTYHFGFKIYVNNTDNEWTTLDSTTIAVYSDFNVTKLHLLTSNGAWEATRHSMMDKSFQMGNITGIFVAVGTSCANISYYFSGDNGTTWNFGEDILNPNSNPTMFNILAENDTGTPRLHWSFSDEWNGHDLEYRCAQILPNGTLSWYTSSFIVVWDVDATHGCNSRSMFSNGTGNVFIEVNVWNATSGSNIEDLYYLIKNQWTNGSWSTASGYPFLIGNFTQSSPYVASLTVGLGGDEALVIYSSPHVWEPDDGYNSLYSKWYNGSTLDSSYQNITGVGHYTLEYLTAASLYQNIQYYVVSLMLDAVSDPTTHNVHLTYTRDTNEPNRGNYSDIRYCFWNYTSKAWQIQDQLISNKGGLITWYYGTYTIGAESKTYPVMSWDAYDNATKVNWLSDDSVYLAQKVGQGAWKVERILATQVTTCDPNILVPLTHSPVTVLGFFDSASYPSNVYTYSYFTIPFTVLNVGWNNLTIWNTDVGRTLGQVNASLNLDNVNWAVITVDYLNGTQWSLVYGTSYNSEKVIVSTNNRLYIYCNVAGTWGHTYP
jgi:hypothetical protein